MVRSAWRRTRSTMICGDVRRGLHGEHVADLDVVALLGGLELEELGLRAARRPGVTPSTRSVVLGGEVLVADVAEQGVARAVAGALDVGCEMTITSRGRCGSPVRRLAMISALMRASTVWANCGLALVVIAMSFALRSCRWA